MSQLNRRGSDRVAYGARPDLSVGGKSESLATNDKVERLERRELARRDGQETSGLVGGGTSGRLVLLEVVSGDEDEGGAGVDDPGCGLEQCGAIGTVRDRLVDAPVGRGRRCLRDGNKVAITHDPVKRVCKIIPARKLQNSELGRVHASEAEFAVHLSYPDRRLI